LVSSVHTPETPGGGEDVTRRRAAPVVLLTTAAVEVHAPDLLETTGV
jgi:hypothetical protein